MKKTILLFAVCLFAFANFQTVQAQTKEETIEWIKEKIELHWSYEGWKIENLIVTPCEISYKRSDPSEKGSVSVKFDPSASPWEEEKGWINAKGKVIEYYYPQIQVTNYYSSILLEEKGVPDITERFAKALNHLATFCEKKKETF